jgi:hypothetical protein
MKSFSEIFHSWHRLTNSRQLGNILFWILLSIVVAIVAYAPIRYHFVYPTYGDDAAYHITYLGNLKNNLAFIQKLPYYGYLLLLPFTYLGVKVITVYSIFNYAVIAFVFLAMWLLLKRFFGIASAVLGFVLSVFIARGMWQFYYDGTIFNIFNLFVVGFLGVYSLCAWLESGNRKWLAVSGLLFAVSSLVHSTTYIYILCSMLTFLVAFGAIQAIRKDKVMQKRLFLFGLVFCVSFLCAWVTWLHGFVLKGVGHDMLNTVVQNTSSPLAPLNFTAWVKYSLSDTIKYLLVLAVILLGAVFFKGTIKEKRDLAARLIQPLSCILLSFIIVLGIGSFTKLGYVNFRVARDLQTFVGLGVGILLGLGLTYYKQWPRYLVLVVLIFVVTSGNYPWKNWLSDYTAVKPCDLAAIAYIDSLSDNPISVQLSDTIAPWIYQLYTNKNISYDRVFDLTNISSADYLLFRDKEMNNGSEKTYSTGFIFKPTTMLSLDWREVPIEYPLTKLAEFQSDNCTITIYKVER